MEKKKKKHGFPSAYTVLFIVIIFAAVLTYVIPAGQYSTLAFNTDSGKFEVTKPSGTVIEMPATQATLDKLHVNASLEKFKDGTIYKPMAVRGTYVKMHQNGQGLKALILAPIDGVYDVVDIILFIFMIGGTVGILNFMGAFNAGITELARVSKGREEIIVAVVTFLIALGGTTFGMAEETIAFYPILIPIFLKSGYDAMVGIAAIYAGSSIGCMFSTVNPFSVVIASNAAGINFNAGLSFRLIGLIIGTVLTAAFIIRYAKRVKADPEYSIIYEDKRHIEDKFNIHDENAEEAPKLSLRYKVVLTMFFATFVIMIIGVSKLGWWFGEMAALFMCSAILIGIVGGLTEKDISREFISGASDLVGVALVCGLARAVNILLENGKISDTLLHTMSGWVSGMNPVLFIVVMMLVFIILGFFINSSSGLAVLSIPIMAPLADAVGLPRELVISAYIYGLGLIGLITPTGLILASLEMVDVTYNKWLKFCWPLMVIWTILGMAMLVVEIYI
jgi:uncharacterized ion transporter superfamily protein YfcC